MVCVSLLLKLDSFFLSAFGVHASFPLDLLIPLAETIPAIPTDFTTPRVDQFP